MRIITPFIQCHQSIGKTNNRRNTMEKNEIIFFAIVILAYILCAFTLDIPIFIHKLLAIGIIIVLVMSIILKYQPKSENDKLCKIMNVLLIGFTVFYFASVISEVFYSRMLIIDSTWTLILIFILFGCRWFFAKKRC